MEYFKIPTIPGYNIAHFFHEALFYALDAYIKNNQIKWILCKKLKEWELQFTLLCIKHLNIMLFICDSKFVCLLVNAFTF